MRLPHILLIALAAVLATNGLSPGDTDAPAVKQAKQRMIDSQSELSKAKAQMAAIVRRVTLEFEATPEWKHASLAAKEAQKKHMQAVDAVRNKLRDDPAYKAAIAERIRCQTARDALHDQPNPPPSQSAQAAVALLNATAEMNRLERQALASDAKATDTAADLAAANGRLDELRGQLPDLVKKEPAFEPARQRLEQAMKQANDAGQQLAQAKKQQDQDDEKRMNNEINSKRDELKNVFRK